MQAVDPPFAVDGVTLERTPAGVVRVKAAGIDATHIKLGAVKSPLLTRAPANGAGVGGVVASATIRYFPLLGDATGQATEGFAASRATRAFTIHAIAGRLSANAATSSSGISLVRNGIEIVWATVAPAAAGIFQFGTGLESFPVAVAAGDLLELRVTNGGGGSLTFEGCTMEVSS